MLTRRSAEISDVDQLVDIHMRNFDPDEFSMTLGSSFIRRFYSLAIGSPAAHVTVGTQDNGDIFCFTVGFADYVAFQSRMRRAILIPMMAHMLSRIVTGRLGEALSVVRYTTEKTAPIPDSVARHHMGLICLDRQTARSPAHIIFFYKLFEDTVRLVKDAGDGRCWTSAFADNRTSVRLIRDVIKPNAEFVFRERPKATLGFVCDRSISPRNEDRPGSA